MSEDEERVNRVHIQQEHNHAPRHWLNPSASFSCPSPPYPFQRWLPSKASAVVAAHPVEHTPERFGHHEVRGDCRQRVCARLQEWIGGQARLGAFRAEVVFTHGWTSHRALPIHGEPNMQDGGDMNHRFLLTFWR